MGETGIPSIFLITHHCRVGTRPMIAGPDHLARPDMASLPTCCSLRLPPLAPSFWVWVCICHLGSAPRGGRFLPLVPCGFPL